MSEVRHGLFGHDRTGKGFRDDLLGHDRELKSKWEEIQWLLLPREELQRYVQPKHNRQRLLLHAAP